MKQPCGIGVGGFLAALLLAACGGVAPNSSVAPLGTLASQGAIPSITVETPLGCRPGLHVEPGVATIKLGQRLHLYDHYTAPSSPYSCDRSPVYASWTASGGVIQSPGGGKSPTAVFFAELPGVYHVQAEWNGYTAHAKVTVTSP